MFIQAHDPDYVLEPIYPEYIPLEDEHELLAEEQPLPPVYSPTAESPGHVTESNPEEDPEECEDDETEDGPVDYPMDKGDDGDDDDGNSSRDDADDEDEDEEEEEEHLALADSAVVVPTDEPVSPPEGTEPVIPPPSTDITIRARITFRPQASISLPPEAEVERLLAMTTPSPSPPILLSPPCSITITTIIWVSNPNPVTFDSGRFTTPPGEKFIGGIVATIDQVELDKFSTDQMKLILTNYLGYDENSPTFIYMKKSNCTFDSGLLPLADAIQDSKMILTYTQTHQNRLHVYVSRVELSPLVMADHRKDERNQKENQEKPSCSKHF
ncbi:hypothetical protein Tco_1558412 [Tanacetum coccineum]